MADAAPRSAPAQGILAMRPFLPRFMKFMRNDDGPTAVEYAVMLSLIMVVCIVSVIQVGRQSRRDYRSVSRTLQKANSGS
jgi:pilus assembly protein Flp/PilA